MEVNIATDATAAAEAAAAFIAKRVWPAVRKRGRFDLAVSGGSTPAPMFAALAAADLPWGTVHLFQVDERVAPNGHPDRNAGQLDVFRVPSVNRHLFDVDWGDQRLVATSYAAALPAALDVVQLGLGDDGHTASWPPGDHHVMDSTRLVEPVRPFHGRARYTLTPVAVNAARCRVVLVTGEAKAAVVERWLAGDASLPASRIKQAATHVFLDEAAAATKPRPARANPASPSVAGREPRSVVGLGGDV